jgi:hypothetical protein
MVPYRQAKPGELRYSARGLCVNCRPRCDRDGTLADYERTNRSLADSWDAVRVLKARGLSRAEIAEALHIKPKSVTQIVYRHRSRGGDR